MGTHAAQPPQRTGACEPSSGRAQRVCAAGMRVYSACLLQLACYSVLAAACVPTACVLQRSCYSMRAAARTL
eukprot:351625-Chlamydomonas_euryale.AAC.2